MSSFKLLALICLCLLLLIFRFWTFYQQLPVYHDGQPIRFESRLTEEPKVSSGTKRFKLDIKDELQVNVVVRSTLELSYGDRLFIDGVFTKKEYQGHVYWSIYFPKLQIIKKEENIVTQFALNIRNKAKTIYNESLSPTESGLLLGIIFGGKQGMPEDFLDKLQVVGALHVIAASGMNVSFVAGALLFLLGNLMRRQFALILGIIGVIFYTFITGLEPSIVRAAIMAIFAFSASFFGRQYFAVFTLFLTGYLMLLWQPSYLFSVGFQLSFLATLGILVVKPVLDEGVTKLGKLGGLRDDVTTTMAAQIGTLPILLGVFGTVGIVSLLVNCLILWTVPFLMTFGSLSVLVSFFCEPLGKLLAFICLPFLWYFEVMVNYFGEWGWMWHTESFSWEYIIGYYLVVLAVIVFFQKKKKTNQPDDASDRSVKIL